MVDLCLKHFVYFVTSNYLNLESFFLTLVSTCQVVHLLSAAFHIFLETNNVDESVCLVLGGQILALVLFGMVQFFNNMTVWDHKVRLYVLYGVELVKYLALLFLVTFLFAFNLFKMFIVQRKLDISSFNRFLSPRKLFNVIRAKYQN
jgi:hypothetical protein